MFGQLDILVNNAGISQPPTPLEQTSLEMWREQIDINLTGVFLCTRGALPLMKRGATIINNLSAAAKQKLPKLLRLHSGENRCFGFHAVAARGADAARHSRYGADAWRDLDRHLAADYARRAVPPHDGGGERGRRPCSTRCCCRRM